MKKKHAGFSVEGFVPGPHGVLSLQESVAHCTRCNACVQSCPAYIKQPQELFSPRGRIQTLRLLAERKVKETECAEQLGDLVNSCLLCARCTSVCAAQIPVAHYMLLLNKMLSARRPPHSLYFFLWLYNRRPVWFDFFARAFLALRRGGAITVAQHFLPTWLGHLHHLIPKGARALSFWLKQENIELYPSCPSVMYLPSLYASYADSQAGRAVCRLLQDKKPYVLLGYSSGLAEYLYGEEVWTLRAAKRLLTRWEKLSRGRNLPLVTDSIEVYSFLQNYPLLFAHLPAWQERAKKMALQVRFITDYCLTEPTNPSTYKTALDISSVLYPIGQVAANARKILLAKSQKNLLECEYSRFPLPAAGLGLVCRPLAEEWVRRQVQDIASRQIANIYCLSGWGALELGAALKCLYPSANAQHLIFVYGNYGPIQKGKHTAIR